LTRPFSIARINRRLAICVNIPNHRRLERDIDLLFNTIFREVRA
jgi:hypothetical protein